MSMILPIMLLLLLVGALFLSKRHIVIAFLVPVMILPFGFLALDAAYQSATQQQDIFDFSEILSAGLFLSMLGIPIFFIVVLPVYHGLLRIHLPIIATFPMAVAVIMLLVAYLITERPLTPAPILAIAGCGLIHAFVILSLISTMKSFSK